MLYLLDKRVHPIHGREWLKAVNLDWNKIKSVSAGHKFNLKERFEKYAVVFSDRQGKIKNLNASLKGQNKFSCLQEYIPISLVDMVETEFYKHKRKKSTKILMHTVVFTYSMCSNHLDTYLYGSADYFLRFPVPVKDAKNENVVSILQLQLIHEIPTAR